MRVKLLKELALLGALCIGVALLGWPALQQWQHSFKVSHQREWISNAVQELAKAGPPPSGRDGQGAWWSLPGYLIFSNGWAAYKIHTIHRSQEIGDATVLRTSSGALYLSHTHFCTGITELMRPRPLLDETILPPSDAKDFFEHYGKLQGWDLFSPDERLWCVINSRDQEKLHGRKKALWVWISDGEGTNRTTLFERRYTVAGSYVSSSTRWLSNECVAVDIYDYGPIGSPRNYPDSLRSNHLMSLSFRRDNQSGRFAEGN